MSLKYDVTGLYSFCWKTLWKQHHLQGWGVQLKAYLSLWTELLYRKETKDRKKKKKSESSQHRNSCLRSMETLIFSVLDRGERSEVTAGRGWGTEAAPLLLRCLLTLTLTFRIWFLCEMCSHTGVKVFVRLLTLLKPSVLIRHRGNDYTTMDSTLTELQNLSVQTQGGGGGGVIAANFSLIAPYFLSRSRISANLLMTEVGAKTFTVRSCCHLGSWK